VISCMLLVFLTSVTLSKSSLLWLGTKYSLFQRHSLRKDVMIQTFLHIVNKLYFIYLNVKGYYSFFSLMT